MVSDSHKDIYELSTVASPHWVVKLRFTEATGLPNIIYLYIMSEPELQPKFG